VVKKLPIIYGTQEFISVFTDTPWARWMQSTSHAPICSVWP